MSQSYNRKQHHPPHLTRRVDGGRNKRNAPCACGSGRKWKKCCGKPPRLQPRFVSLLEPLRDLHPGLDLRFEPIGGGKVRLVIDGRPTGIGGQDIGVAEAERRGLTNRILSGIGAEIKAVLAARAAEGTGNFAQNASGLLVPKQGLLATHRRQGV